MLVLLFASADDDDRISDDFGFGSFSLICWNEGISVDVLSMETSGIGIGTVSDIVTSATCRGTCSKE
jgi:hypothetical protein